MVDGPVGFVLINKVVVSDSNEDRSGGETRQDGGRRVIQFGVLEAMRMRLLVATAGMDRWRTRRGEKGGVWRRKATNMGPLCTTLGVCEWDLQLGQ